MGFISHVIRDRKTAVFTKGTCLCAGAAAGLCFGNGYAAAPRGVDTFAAFFSYGLDFVIGCPKTTDENFWRVS